MNQLLLHRWTQYFNSQPHEEADECLVTPLVEMLHFNSQPHEEADRLDGIRITVIYISTHSLTKRLTNGNTAVHGFAKYFNSQPHEEADERIMDRKSYGFYFNSQPHEEADRRVSRESKIYRNFNSQPHEEADP